jgi:hypothetical protein
MGIEEIEKKNETINRNYLFNENLPAAYETPNTITGLARTKNPQDGFQPLD